MYEWGDCFVCGNIVDDEFNFASRLERPTLNRSANEEVFQEILEIFNSQLNQEEFIKTNKKNFAEKAYYSLKRLDTKNLQTNYNALKKNDVKLKTDLERVAVWL